MLLPPLEELRALRNKEDPAERPEMPLAAPAAPLQLSPAQTATGGAEDSAPPPSPPPPPPPPPAPPSSSRSETEEMFLSVADEGEVNKKEKEETAITRTVGWERYGDPATEVAYWLDERTHE